MSSIRKPFRISCQPVFRFFADLVGRGWFVILPAAILITAASVHFTLKLDLDTNVMSLLPGDDPVVKDFFETSRLFGVGERLLAVIELDEGLSEETAMTFMQHFGGLLKESPLIARVEYKLPALSFDEKAKRLEDKFDIRYTYFNTPEKDMFLMLITPVTPPGDIRFSRILMAKVEELEYEARRRMEGNITGLNVGYAGGHAIGVGESQSFERNVKVTVLTTFLCVLFLFSVAFKRMGIVVSVGLTLAMSILWTLMIAYFAFGSLNVMSVGFAAILAGLGVDFGIHIGNRFMFEISSGKNAAESVRAAVLSTGEAIFFGCITTSLAFYSLLLTNFRGASELGFLIGTGLIVCALAMVLVLPSMLVLGSLVSRRPRQLSPFFSGLGSLGRAAERRGRSIAVVGLLLFAGWSALVFSKWPLPDFDNRLENMSSRRNNAVVTQKKILKRFGNYYEPVSMVARSKHPDETVRLMRAATPRIEALVENGCLGGYDSIFKYLSPFEKGGEIIKRRGTLKNPERAVDYLIKKLEKMESKKEEYEFVLREKDSILRLLKSDPSQEITTYEGLRQILPGYIFRKFFAEDKTTGEVAGIAYLYPSKRIVGLKESRQLSSHLGINGSNLRVAGISLVAGRLERMIRDEFGFVTLCIGLVVALILTLLYRRPVLTLISMLPLLLSLAATISIMIFFDIRLNYMNVVAFPLIIGIGIDDSIHMIYRYYENHERSVGTMVEQTGRAVLLTSLTTMSGFGSLLVTDHSGLMSLGMVTALGIGFCLVTSLLILPGLLLFWESSGPFRLR